MLILPTRQSGGTGRRIGILALCAMTLLLGGCPLVLSSLESGGSGGGGGRSESDTGFRSDQPVYLDYATLRSSVQVVEPRTLASIERVYVYENRLFLNARNQGVHVIDNSDPSAPINTAFIEIPGNTELAIRDGVLFADSYVDLVAIDIAEASEPSEVSRQIDVFPWDAYQNVPSEVYFSSVDLDPDRGVVIGHE